jgi:hypothetical protein
MTRDVTFVHALQTAAAEWVMRLLSASAYCRDFPGGMSPKVQFPVVQSGVILFSIPSGDVTLDKIATTISDVGEP